MIVAGGTDDITVYDADTLEILFQEVDAHSGRVNDVAFFSAPDGLKIASGGNDGALKLWRVQPAAPVGCSVDADCDDSNECTENLCDEHENVCKHPPVSENTACNGVSGVCCGGSCTTAACGIHSDCYDVDTCSLAYICTNPDSCAAACVNTTCGAPKDGCCGPFCGQNDDPDCCVPTHNKEKGPRCSDDIDNDCDGDVDEDDPDC
jgi:WD40 repeat protein